MLALHRAHLTLYYSILKAKEPLKLISQVCYTAFTYSTFINKINHYIKTTHIIHIRKCVLLWTCTTVVLVDLPHWCSFLEGNIPLSSTLTGQVETYQVHTYYMCAYLSAGPPTPCASHY